MRLRNYYAGLIEGMCPLQQLLLFSPYSLPKLRTAAHTNLWLQRKVLPKDKVLSCVIVFFSIVRNSHYWQWLHTVSWNGLDNLVVVWNIFVVTRHLNLISLWINKVSLSNLDCVKIVGNTNEKNWHCLQCLTATFADDTCVGQTGKLLVCLNSILLRKYSSIMI